MFNEYKKIYPDLASEYTRIILKRELPLNWEESLPKFNNVEKIATRKLSSTTLNAIAPKVTELIGGSADLTPSTLTEIKCSEDFQANTPHGRYIRFGVREHAMFAIGNGISVYGFIPFTSTFLNFITYGWGAVRLAALSHIRHIFIMTHDSVFLGEDGPTHQPIEVIPLIRATPNILFLRPCDGNEVVGSWSIALTNKNGPTVLALSRQSLPNLLETNSSNVEKGAYRIYGKDENKIIFIATGSEVNICLTAAKKLSIEGIQISVISAPCLELFELQSLEYKEKILPLKSIIISVEASSSFGWKKYASHHVSIDRFGVSGELKQISEFFKFTSEKLCEKIKLLKL